jgi:hypothetical protein
MRVFGVGHSDLAKLIIALNPKDGPSWNYP